MQFWTACCQPAVLKCFVFSFEWTKPKTSDDWCAAVTLHDEQGRNHLLSTYRRRKGYGSQSDNEWLFRNPGAKWQEPWYPCLFDSAKGGK
ncbi:MAG: hypothetical protein VX716_08800, partial [SAR324 cluster bacterium]|nr:hypothetical protein [SAR324 cluster bacterium]